MSVELSVEKVTPRNLTKVLDENGITLTRAERATLLDGLPETLTRRVKNLIAKTQGIKEAAASARKVAKGLLAAAKAGLDKGTPVVALFELIPGLSYGNQYRVIARLGSAFIAAKSFGSEFKVKFYPSFDEFCVTQETLGGGGAYAFKSSVHSYNGLSASGGKLNPAVYQRYMIAASKFPAQFEALRSVPGIEIASPKNTEILFAGGEPSLALQTVAKVRTKTKAPVKLAKKRKQAA